jgi:predicted TIM-barrel fold metal-dependent hydrolase
VHRGIEWAPLFCRKLDKNRGMGRNGPWIGGPLPDRPSEIFKRHVRMHPFWEDDIVSVVEELGPDVIIGGSDFPHSEGLADPLQLAEHLAGLDAATQKAIMRDNGMALVGLA